MFLFTKSKLFNQCVELHTDSDVGDSIYYMERDEMLIELELTFRVDMELFYPEENATLYDPLYQPIFREHCGMLSLVGFVASYERTPSGIILIWERIKRIADLELFKSMPKCL